MPRFNIRHSNDALAHYGTAGMKWGVWNAETTIRYTGARAVTSATTAKGLRRAMGDNVKYARFSKLKSPEETLKSGRGSCHDQTLLAHRELSRLGYKPKAAFCIELPSNGGIGGETHSFSYFEKGKKTYWFENTLESKKGIRGYNSVNDMKRDVENSFGNRKKFPRVEWGDFDPSEHTPGESLQDLVDKCLE